MEHARIHKYAFSLPDPVPPLIQPALKRPFKRHHELHLVMAVPVLKMLPVVREIIEIYLKREILCPVLL